MIFHKRILFSYLILLITNIFFNTSLYLQNNLLVTFSLFNVILATALIFFYLKSLNEKILIYLFIFLGLPALNYPFSSDSSVMSFIFQDIILRDIDRVIINFFYLTIFSFLFFISLLNKVLIMKKIKYIIVLTVLFVFDIFFLNYHSYDNYSIYQVFIDQIYALSLINIILFFKLKLNDTNFLILNLDSLLKIFSFIVLFDVIICLTFDLPWSRSYRDGIQGNLYGNEIPFSIAIMVSSIYLIYKSNNNYIRFFLLIIFSYLIFLTNIKSAVFALILSCLIFFYKKVKGINYARSIVFLTLIFLIVNFSAVFENENLGSSAARIGTYVVYSLTLLEDYNFLFGIMPGSSSWQMQSNLAMKVFESDYVSILNLFSVDTMTSELIERSSYSEGGEFLPHNTFLVIISSFGILAFYLLKYFIRFFKFILNPNIYIVNNNKLPLAIFISMIFLSITHANFLFFEIIFFGEIIYLNSQNFFNLNT